MITHQRFKVALNVPENIAMYTYKFTENNLVIIVYILNIEMSLVTFISARDSGMKRYQSIKQHCH